MKYVRAWTQQEMGICCGGRTGEQVKCVEKKREVSAERMQIYTDILGCMIGILFILFVRIFDEKERRRLEAIGVGGE